MKTLLQIKQLVLSVHLGWESKERSLQQVVYLDMAIRFKLPPTACQNDELDDTQCYATLIDYIRAHIETKHYKLIEYLAQEIYHIAQSQLPAESQLQICITKFPKIGGLTGGVLFHYGDF